MTWFHSGWWTIGKDRVRACDARCVSARRDSPLASSARWKPITIRVVGLKGAQGRVKTSASGALNMVIDSIYTDKISSYADRTSYLNKALRIIKIMVRNIIMIDYNTKRQRWTCEMKNCETWKRWKFQRSVTIDTLDFTIAMNDDWWMRLKRLHDRPRPRGVGNDDSSCALGTERNAIFIFTKSIQSNRGNSTE